MSQPRRILIVANFQRKGLYRQYYNHESKLAAGFTRAGHNVICFSDRDHAREATRLHTQKAGAGKMAAKLIEVAQHYQPHLILFGHSDLLRDDFYLELKQKVPAARLACFGVDALFRTDALNHFAARCVHMDVGFITSWHREKLAALGLNKGMLYFLPNPVDPAIETADTSAVPLSDLPYDGQFLGTGTGKREEQLQALMAALPADYRFNCGGLAFGSERLVSTRFLAALTQGAVCPNLPIDDSDLDQIDPLYSSDRIAQTLGQGVTTLVHERSELTRLYEDGIVTYQSRDDLVEQMLALKGDDARRRVVGAKGRALAHERTNVTLVAAYMLAAGLGETLPEIFWDAAPV